jgi:hypothetical protein
MFKITTKNEKRLTRIMFLSVFFMAGVAGFEPTNDGVRGCTKPLKMAKNQ